MIPICGRVGAPILQEVAVLLGYLLELWILRIESDVASMSLRICAHSLWVYLDLLKPGIVVAITALGEVDELVVGGCRLILNALPDVRVFGFIIASHCILYFEIIPIVLLILHQH